MRSHPDWYYERYDEIFGVHTPGDRFRESARLIEEIAPLEGRSVQEIGAGTGSLARALLASSPASLELVDDDPTAVTMLEAAFAGDAKVSVRQGDGFDGSWTQFYDRVVATYSIILQDVDSHGLKTRIRTLASRLHHDGVVVFEWIDATVSAEVFRDGIQTIVWEAGDSKLHVSSHYGEGTMQIAYGGTIDGRPVDYSVRLLGISQPEMDSLCREAAPAGSVLGTRLMDQEGRRRLTFIRMPDG